MKRRKKIVVVDYDPDWVVRFESLRSVLAEKTGQNALTIEHVGSTAVVGLAAKPVIDLDIVVADDERRVRAVIRDLDELGYRHRGDLGITGREAFAGRSANVPLTEPERIWPEHHLYVCRENSAALKNHLFLRDYLRQNARARGEYGGLKKRLADEHPDDIDSYIDGKTDFILSILRKSGIEQDQLSAIRRQNEKR